MDSFELNKIVGAVLLGLLVFMGIRMSAESLFHVEDPETKGYYVEVASADVPDATEVVVEAGPSIAELLQTASADAGRQAFGPCRSCHSTNAADGHRLGPNLFGVLGSPVARHADYAYSDAMISHGGVWDFERLDAYLTRPADAIPGNKMIFAGIGRDSRRANLIAYLNSMSDDPLPIPAFTAEEIDEELVEAVAGEEGGDGGEDAPVEDEGEEAPADDESGDQGEEAPVEDEGGL